MVDVRRLTVAEAGEYSRFTFPVMRSLLAGDVPFVRILVGALDGGTPVGLALAAANPEKGLFELLSLYVTPMLRFQGVGRRLLAQAEQEGRHHGCTGGWHFLTVPADDQGALRFLLKTGWTVAQVRQLVLKSPLRRRPEVPALARAPRRPGFRVIGWHEVTAGQRAAMLARHQREAPWYSPTLDPFLHEPGCLAETSVALVDARDSVVGWLIAHQVGDTTHRVTCANVSPELRRLGLLLTLVADSLDRQARDTTLTDVIWTVPMEMTAMTRFMRRRFAPWMDMFGYACTAHRRLGGCGAVQAGSPPTPRLGALYR